MSDSLIRDFLRHAPLRPDENDPNYEEINEQPLVIEEDSEDEDICFILRKEKQLIKFQHTAEFIDSGHYSGYSNPNSTATY